MWLRPTEVFNRTGVKLASQYHIIARWKRRGFIIEKAKRDGGPRLLSVEQVAWVTSKDTLESMTHLSLRRRVQLVREKFDLASLTHQALHKYYLRCGVKFKRPDYKFWKSNAENLRLKDKQF